ncbi:MAG: hypothetical protein OSJ27_04335 [Candidatus Gastranaerophilales bacterium]|nr:hypothetical protein [Candidatus Gastranaerophilales bacterium]
MLTHKKKLFRNITLFALALSLVQTCWAGFLSEQKDESLNQNALLSMNVDDANLQEDASTLALKQMIDNTSESSMLNLNSPEARNTTTRVKLDGSVAITDSPNKITLSLRDSDVRQVLRMFADKAGINVVFHSSVDGKVTLDLVDVTLNDAFLLVMKSSELTYVKDGKNLIISSMEASKDLGIGKQNLTVIPIKYVEAPAVAKFLNANVFSAKMAGVSNKQVVASNPRTNEILIFGTENDAAVAEKIVAQVDKKPMVNVFKVNHTTPKEMAALICDTMMPSNTSLNNQGTATQSAQTQIDDGETEQDSEDDTIKAVKLGGGFIACRATAVDTTGGATGNITTDGSTVVPFPSVPMTITFSPDLGTVTVYGGSVEQLNVIKDFIAKNDIKQAMAYIELAVIELNEEGQKEFDNVWNLWTPFLSVGFSSSDGISNMGGNRKPIIFGPDGTPAGAKYSGSSVLSYQLKYLVNNQKGRVLTNPKIMVTNGQKSIIDLTSDYVKTTSTEMNTNSATDTPIVTRTYELGNDEGLKIEMIPFISQDGYVSLNMVPEFSTIKSQMKTKDEYGEEVISATMLQRRNLKLNNLRIKDGETLVIAGLIKESEKQNVTKVPVLGDLPLVGVFFRSTSNAKSKEELVIMITPHIVYSEDQAKEIKAMDL